MSLLEINSAISLVNDRINEDANVIFGTVVDSKMGDKVEVTVIATGVDEVQGKSEVMKNSILG